MKKIILFLLLFLPSLAKAEIEISASVDKEKVALNDSLEISVVISGSGNIPSPQIPELPNFSVYSSGRSQNISVINGKITSSISHSYVLTPRRVGKFTIGSFHVTAEGKTYATQAIEIEVTAAASRRALAPPQTSQGMSATEKIPGAFVTLNVDKPKAYLNEQVILTFRFYNRVQLLSNPEYQPPEKTGFIFEDLPPPREFMESVKGVPYNVTEIKTALFPTQTGNLTISAAALKIVIPSPQERRRDPFFDDDFFGSFFGTSGKEYLLRTDPVRITVHPLPTENKPKEFYGGVGSFRLNASVDKTKLSVDEPLTLTLSVAGTGNIKSLQDPVLPPFAEFRKYDTASSLDVKNSGGRVQGSKTYKIVLVPQTSGQITLPSISFGYFDLESKTYKTLKTPAFPLDISSSQTSSVVITPHAGVTPLSVQKIQQEIRYIRTDSAHLKNFQWIHHNRLTIFGTLTPIFLLILSYFYRIYANRKESNLEQKRFSHAYKNMKKHSLVILSNNKTAVSERIAKLFEIVRNYFADKMLIPPASVTYKTIEQYFEQISCEGSLKQALKNFWNELELNTYAPAHFRSIDVERLTKTAQELIQKIESKSHKGEASFKVLSLWVLFFLFCLCANSPAQNHSDQFKEANHLYQNGKFADSYELYKEMEEKGILNFDLEYNLGNASYKLGQPGEAVLHWLRAWRIHPRNSDVRFNLQFATSQAGEPFFSNTPTVKFFQFLFYVLNLNECGLLFIVILWTFCLLIGKTIVCRRKLLQTRNIVVSILFIFSLAWWIARLNSEVWKKTGVVTIEKAEIRSGPGTQFGVGATIPQARRILILGSPEPDWLEIALPQEGIKGYALKSEVTSVE